MAATPTGARHLAQFVLCHAWNQRLGLLAVSAHSPEILVYAVDHDEAGEWRRVQMLTGHDQVVSGLDWAPTCGLLASCSHDGGCFVWRKDPGGGEWTPLLVVTRLNRAALCLKWSPSEGKFALGTGARTACVCHYEADNDWWVAKKIKQHESSVTSVAWHPSSAILATTSTDRRCRLFNAVIQGVEGDSGHCEAAESTLFGDLLMTIECKWWPHAVAFSPRGARLAVATHGSTIVIVDGLDAQEPNGLANKDILEVKLRGLPLRSLSFLSESVLVGGGFDGEPVVLAMTAQSSQSEWTVAQGETCSHANCIVDLLPLHERGDDSRCRFSTAGLDGRIVIWRINGLVATT